METTSSIPKNPTEGTNLSPKPSKQKVVLGGVDAKTPNPKIDKMDIQRKKAL